MPFYLYEGSYSPEGWASLLAEPKDLAEALRPAIEGLGGSVTACFLDVEKRQAIGFVEFPDNLAAVSWAMLISARPGVASAEIHPVMPTAEAAEAMRSAGAFTSPGNPVW